MFGGYSYEDEDSEPFPEEEWEELELGEPSSEVLEYARKHLNESPDTKASVIQELRDMIYECGEVTPHRMDDAFLVRFLRARRFNVEKAHALMVNYYNFKETYPEIHKNINPLDIRFIADDDVISVLPYREQNGRRVIIYRIGNWLPSNYSADEIFKATVIALELGVMEPQAQVMGGICIFDFEGISLQHAWHTTPTMARMAVDLLASSFPIITQAIHIINESWIFDIMWAIYRPLLNERMRERIFFHGSDMESLHTHIDPKFLPKRYGGMRQEVNYALWIERLRKNEAIIEEMDKLGYDMKAAIEGFNDEERETSLKPTTAEC